MINLMAGGLQFSAYVIVVLLISVTLLTHTGATLSKSDKNKKKEQKVKLSTQNVSERGLVKVDVKYKDILKEHKIYCDVEREVKHFPAITLAYVTPWNSHGYDIAKLFGNKFNYVSPVWLQIKRKSSQFVIEGGHDIDKGWISDVTGGRSVELLPRLLYDSWSSNDFHALFSSESVIQQSISTITGYLKSHKFSGVVLELWSQLGGQRRSELAHYITHLGEAFKTKKLKLILVLPPPINQGGRTGLVSRGDFDAVIDSVDAVSLMTYDYSNYMNPGPNSPLPWMRQCVEILAPSQNSPNREKILLGFNFYGNDYMPGGGGPIVGHEYFEILHKHRPHITWDSQSAEHLLKYKTSIGEHTVYYPTLKSVSARIELSKQLNVGIAIWEIGQGLDYFYDLL